MMKSYLLKKEFFINNHKDQIKDHFEFMRELGRGAYGVVYMAKQKVFPNRLRVVKRISKRKVKDPSILINQLKIAACLDHPHIIKIYQTFQDESSLFLVLDYCEGGELYDRLCEQKVFTESKARTIFRQMVNAVRYMHSQKVAHRDLKLENFMMVSKNSWELMLIDFGLSFQWKKDMKSQVLKTEKGKIIGTPYYISPQILAESYNEKCDIWSLGVILYMLTTGTPPFDGSNDKQIMKNIAKFNFSLNKKQCEVLTPELKHLITQIFKPQAGRITLDQILEHPWLGQHQRPNQILLHLEFRQLMEFTKFAKLKKLVATYIASQLSEMQIESMRDLFENIDHDQDGYITINELHEFLSQKQGQSVALSDLQKIVLSIDTDRNGKINYNQFIAMCIDEAIISNENYMKFAFNSFDLNRDGKIQREEFKTILKSYSKDFNCNEELVEALMMENDKNNDGAIDFSEFRDAMISVKKLAGKMHAQPMDVE